MFQWSVVMFSLESLNGRWNVLLVIPLSKLSNWSSLTENTYIFIIIKENIKWFQCFNLLVVTTEIKWYNLQTWSNFSFGSFIYTVHYDQIWGYSNNYESGTDRCWLAWPVQDGLHMCMSLSLRHLSLRKSIKFSNKVLDLSKFLTLNLLELLKPFYFEIITTYAKDFKSSKIMLS